MSDGLSCACVDGGHNTGNGVCMCGGKIKGADASYPLTSHARKWYRDRIRALEAERDKLKRERDDFEQRLHAWMRGEHG